MLTAAVLQKDAVPEDYFCRDPDHRSIYRFIRNLFHSAQLTAECAIVTLVSCSQFTSFLIFHSVTHLPDCSRCSNSDFIFYYINQFVLHTNACSKMFFLHSLVIGLPEMVLRCFVTINYVESVKKVNQTVISKFIGCGCKILKF